MAGKIHYRPFNDVVGLRVLTLLLAATAFLALGAGPAIAETHQRSVECGETITTDTKLDRNLIDCPGDGIVIGADGIELDLNGHTIDGDGELGCAEFYACDFGVNNTAGHHGLTIQDGSIRDFATAVFVFGGSDNRLRRLSASRNVLGGMLLIESPGARIKHNSISANGLATDQAGLIVFDSGDVRITRNSVRNNGDIGMFLIGIGDSRVMRNSVSGNPEAGMLVEGNGNKVGKNRLSRSVDGMIVTGDGNTIARNRMSDLGGLGISFEGGQGNLIVRNFIAGAGEAGIRVADFEVEGGPPAIDNIVQRNRVLHAEVDGVLVESTATDTLLRHNIAIRAGDDGIDVDSASTTLTRNLALRNGDLGIEAVSGVIDGGGNKARGNGNPLECTNVVCN